MREFDPSRLVVLLDFDGTLAPIVQDPAAARADDRARPVLEELQARGACVGVISGRPLAFLEAQVPYVEHLVGLYGLETRPPDLLGVGSLERWEAAIDEIMCRADTVPAGARLEPKGSSLTCHYRGAEHLESAVVRWARQEAQRTGLEARAAKLSVELHPPIGVDKGSAVAALAAQREGPVVFAGDDLGDLAAFRALATLRAEGRVTLGLAVRSPETPPEVLAAADDVVTGTAGVVAWLEGMLARGGLNGEAS